MKAQVLLGHVGTSANAGGPEVSAQGVLGPHIPLRDTVQPVPPAQSPQKGHLLSQGGPWQLSLPLSSSSSLDGLPQSYSKQAIFLNAMVTMEADGYQKALAQEKGVLALCQICRLWAKCGSTVF